MWFFSFCGLDFFGLLCFSSPFVCFSFAFFFCFLCVGRGMKILGHYQ